MDLDLINDIYYKNRNNISTYMVFWLYFAPILDIIQNTIQTEAVYQKHPLDFC